jgi:hypothetical protein
LVTPCGVAALLVVSKPTERDGDLDAVPARAATSTATAN